MGAVQFLKDMNVKTKDAMLSKYLSYAINAMNPEVKSREEILEDIVTNSEKMAASTGNNAQKNEGMDFSAFSSPSPRQFLNIFKTPSKASSASYVSPSPRGEEKKLDF